MRPRSTSAALSYIYEPEQDEILEALLPRYLSTVILSALLETEAGFQGSQMTAMDNATRNAGDLIEVAAAQV